MTWVHTIRHCWTMIRTVPMKELVTLEQATLRKIVTEGLHVFQ